jgi:hypothetical protein
VDYAWRVKGRVERDGMDPVVETFVVVTTMDNVEAAETAALRELVPWGVPRPHERDLVSAKEDQAIRVTIEELEQVGPVWASRK